ncbi:MAG: ferrous iron transporter B [Bacillota bacterium]
MSASRAEVVAYPETVENALAEICGLLKGPYRISPRAVGLLLLQDDAEIQNLVREREGLPVYQRITGVVKRCKETLHEPIDYAVVTARQKRIGAIIAAAVTETAPASATFADRLSRLMMNPWTGIPLLLLVLYFGLYKFVGGFGAGTVVDFLESAVFDAHIIPWVNNLVDAHVPWASVRELLAHEYGVITLGLRYAIAIVLPLVGTFFFAFAIIEDTGYLPRLAMLIDRVFKKIGLSGRAVIPMTLGFGCDTMATLVSRILETRRERIIATLLLALAIPCSAQLGVIMALLAGRPAAVLMWAGVVALVFMLVGWLAAQILPDQRPIFYMEVPPLRAPRLTNVMIKTYTRMRLYFVEILPLFILASVLIWLGQITGLFTALVNALEPVVQIIGLPKEAAVAFLFGFFRRDYGAAGLYDLHTAGRFDGVQLLVAATTLTLFVPCIAQFIVALKERGAKIAFAMFFFVLIFAFGVGYILNAALRSLGVTL